MLTSLWALGIHLLGGMAACMRDFYGSLLHWEAERAGDEKEIASSPAIPFSAGSHPETMDHLHSSRTILEERGVCRRGYDGTLTNS